MGKFKDAMHASPGPQTPKEGITLYLKGLAMGAADIVPGVSGGTVALISGIYQNLLEAIQSFDLDFLKKLMRFQITDAIAGVHLRFLLVLVLGILTAMVSLAKVMHYFMEHQPVYTWSLFAGMILASIIVLGGSIKGWLGKNGLFFLVGVVLAYGLVGIIPVSTPETWWFIILCGMIAICAMILPGISGSFLLLIMGKYQFITGAIKDPFSVDSIIIIALFLVGATMGITGFSRILTWFLHHFHMATLAFLTGLMTGSMRKIWPWKETLDSITIRGKVHVLQEANIMPQADSGLWIAIGFVVLGFVLVWILDHLSPDIQLKHKDN